MKNYNGKLLIAIEKSKNATRFKLLGIIQREWVDCVEKHSKKK